jgi:predicted transcriptional regulator
VTIPAYQDAKRDRWLEGLPLVVYLHLLDLLDPVVFKPEKQMSLAHTLERSERAIRRAMRLLEKRGYIERGPVKGGEVRTYRLVYSRMP